MPRWPRFCRCKSLSQDRGTTLGDWGRPGSGLPPPTPPSQCRRSRRRRRKATRKHAATFRCILSNSVGGTAEVALSARGFAQLLPSLPFTRTTLSPCRKRTPGGMQHRLGQATAGWAVARPSEGHAAGALLLHELDTSLPVLPGPGTASYAARHTPAPPASKWPCHAMRQRCASLRAWPFLFLAEASLLDSRMRLTFSRAAQTCNSIALVTPPRSGGGARPPRCAPPGSAR